MMNMDAKELPEPFPPAIFLWSALHETIVSCSADHKKMAGGNGSGSLAGQTMGLRTSRGKRLLSTTKSKKFQTMLTSFAVPVN